MFIELIGFRDLNSVTMFHTTYNCSRLAKFVYLNKNIQYPSFQLKKMFCVSVTKQHQDRCLKIQNGPKSSQYHYLWLRDHCQCDKCCNKNTSQRKLNVSEISNEVKPETAFVENNVLNIIWEGGHKSQYEVSWLESCQYDNFIKRIRRKYLLWTKNDVSQAPIARIDHDQLLESDDCLSSLIESLVLYGVGFVEKVPVSIEGTEAAARRIGPVQTTFFGGMWEFSDKLDHQDTAYTKEGLNAHTDNTYFTEAAGLQLLHCLSHDGSGGDTILVDGFKAATILKERFPIRFDRLANTNVGAEYIEDGEHHVFRAPIIRLNPLTKDLEQIRFNMNDRAVTVLPHDQIPSHYEDLRLLNEIVNDPELEWKFKLKPGTLLIIDNFRVLHGRTSYTGKRTMCGCYIGRSDYLSKARVFKAIEKEEN